MRPFARSMWVLVAVATAAAPMGCSQKKDDGTSPTATPKSLPPLVLRDDTPDLMLTWVDDKGDTHVELHAADVPEAGKALVRVVVSDREDGTRDLFYIADLTKKRDDGSYETQTMSRRQWESEIEKRRTAYVAKLAPPPPQQPAQSPSGAPAADEKAAPTDRLAPSGTGVIIYGASWCGPCHQAADHLKAKKVPYVLKDVETTPGAQKEMSEKLARAGRRGGSIPVIDVRGQLLVGFSPDALDRALASSRPGTVL